MIERVWLLTIGGDKFVLDGIVSASQVDEIISILDKMRAVSYIYSSEREKTGTTYSYKNTPSGDAIKAEYIPASEVEGCEA